jgi:hypothetical protein
MNTNAINLKSLIGALLACGLSGTAHATLIDRGSGLIYDDVLNITWLQDANYAKTSGYDADGMMTWADANAWAANLVYGGYDDWRLPDVDPIGAAFNYNLSYNGTTDFAYGITSQNSELAYMYYVNLGLKPYKNPNGTQRADWGIFGNGTFNGTDYSFIGQNDVGPFTNLQNYYYWFGEDWAINPQWGWEQSMLDGLQGGITKNQPLYAWAVRPGDIVVASDPDPTPNPAPEPATLALLAMGLLGMVGSQALRKERPGSRDFQGAQGA